MPANLPPTYHEAEQRFRSAVTVEEKIACLEEMLRIMPKHKGTDKLQADLKSRIAKLRRQPKKKAGARTDSHHIPREGAGQVALVGPPNSGKSSLVRALSHAEPEVAHYPFTTRAATPGMMAFEDIAFQLIDLPPLSEEFVEPWVYDAVRRCDLAWLVLDLEKALEGLELCQRLLQSKAIEIVPVGSSVSSEKRPGWTSRETLLVLTGLDKPGAEEDLSLLGELLQVPWSRVAVSAVNGSGFEELRRATFDALDIVRVYCKQPGKPVDREQPFTVRRGSTVGDVARVIHKEIAEGLRFARVWGTDVYDGQKVTSDYVVQEGDIVELHI